MIGILLDDKSVGIYSLAALFFEGIFQFSIVIRNIINPEIGKLYCEKKYRQLIYLIRYSSILSFVLVIIISVISYYMFVYILFFIDNTIIYKSHEGYDFPICFAFPAGHQDDNRAIVFGDKSLLEISAKKVRLTYPY